MAVRQIWLVVKLPNNTNGNDREGRPRNIDDLVNNRGAKFPREETIKEYYINETEAVQACEKLASTNPLTPYAVMGISSIRETGVPQVLAKTFTPEGELVIV